MSENRITWTAKTRRGMKRIVGEGLIAMSLKIDGEKLTKGQQEEVENAMRERSATGHTSSFARLPGRS